MSANRPYDDEEDFAGRGYTERRSDPNRADREISLGTPTILILFFVLALAFAAVFGVGYSMGHKSAQTAVVPADPSSGIAVTSASKPSAGAPGAIRVSDSPPPADDPPASAPPAETATVPLNPPPAAAKPAVEPADRVLAGEKVPSAAPQPTTNNQQPTTSYVVQVAAVSSQDVADILLSSLQKKGYTVAVRHEPQDKLLHVQIGPFADKKEAEAMRQRVLADGFNAIVK
jgi:cell division septation protein DedD